jgi:hypothetical protein
VIFSDVLQMVSVKSMRSYNRTDGVGLALVEIGRESVRKVIVFVLTTPLMSLFSIG